MAHAPVRTRKKSNDHDIHKFQGKESILTSQIEIFVEEEKPKVPDGGWGWVIVLAAFMLNTISEGISFSFGLLYVEFLNEFKASKSATSWIGSLFLALPLLAGPIGSALVDRYGCIYMTILGSLICTTGFVMSVFAQSIGVIYLTFGVIGGVGRCLTFVTAVVSIAFWFEKRRTVALGVAASGAGFGTIIFAPFTTWLLSEYGWRGTILILGGCFFNMCVCGATMRDPAWIVQEELEKKTKVQNDPTKDHNPKIEEIKKLIQEGNAQCSLKNANKPLSGSGKNKINSEVDLPTYLRNHEKVPVEVINQLRQNEQLYKIVSENYPHLITGSDPREQTTTPKLIEQPILEADETEEDNEVNTNKAMPLLTNNAAVPSGIRKHSHSSSHSYLNQIKQKKGSTGNKLNIESVVNVNVTTVSCPDVYGETLASEKKEEQKWYVEFFSSLKNLLNLSLFLELHFFLLSVSTTILFIWFIVPYFYIAEHMNRLGYSESDASMALSAIGFTNTIGMVFLGWAGDRLNIAKVYAICLIFCGISVALIIYFANNYILLIINSALFGLFFASCFSLLPSLLAELVPLEEFTMAYGLVLLCQGIGNLIGPPLAGFLFDLSGSWEQTFYQAAVWIVVSGVLIGVIPYSTNRRIIGGSVNKNANKNDSAA